MLGLVAKQLKKPFSFSRFNEGTYLNDSRFTDGGGSKKISPKHCGFLKFFGEATHAKKFGRGTASPEPENHCLATRAKRERSVVRVSEANEEVFLLPKNQIGAVVFANTI